MIGSKVTVYLNNKLVVDDQPLINYWDRKTPVEKRKPLLKKGPIQLQTHGGEFDGEIFTLGKSLPLAILPQKKMNTSPFSME